MSESTKIVVCGGRSFNNRDYVFKRLDQLLEGIENPVIIQGGAKGADKLAADYAQAKDIPLETYPADWKTFGKRAGYLRNEEMAKAGDICIVFPGGKGTAIMALLAKMHGLEVIEAYELPSKTPMSAKDKELTPQIDISGDSSFKVNATGYKDSMQSGTIIPAFSHTDSSPIWLITLDSGQVETLFRIEGESVTAPLERFYGKALNNTVIGTAEQLSLFDIATEVKEASAELTQGQQALDPQLHTVASR